MSSYYPADVMKQMREESDAAIVRLAKWMAKVRLNDEQRNGQVNFDVEKRREQYIASYMKAFEEAE